MDFYGFLENFCWLYGFVCVSAVFLWILSYRFMDFYGFLFFKWIMDFFRLGLCGGLGWWFEGAGILWFFGFLAFWDFFFHRLLSKRGSAGVGRTSSLYRNTRWPRRPLGKHWSAALKCDIFWPASTLLRYGCGVSGCWTHKASLYRNTCWPFYLGKVKTATQGRLWPLNNAPNNVCQVSDRSTSFFRLLGPRFSKNMFKNFKFPDPQTSNPNHHINPCWFLWNLYWFLWCSGEFYWFLFFFLVSGEFFGFLWFSEEFLWVSGELSWICGFYGFVRQGAGSENMSLV